IRMNQIPYTKEQLFRANVKLMEQIVRNFRKRIGGIRTRREKLEVIKEKYQAKRLNGRTSVLSVNPTELDWLIKQAERTQELEEYNRILSSDKSMFIEELVREQQQNKRYRELIKKLKRMVYDPDVDCGMICTEIIEMEEWE